MFEQTGETEKAEKTKVRKKRENKKKDGQALMALVAEPAPAPGSLSRRQKKNASSFFKELREELHCAPAVPCPDPPSQPEVHAAAVSSSPLKKTSGGIEVVEFHSRHKKRKLKQDPDENAKVMSWLGYV